MRYQYIITVQFEARNGVQQVIWREGIITPSPGQTRSDLFAQVFGQAAREGVNGVPLFFSLEPEDL